MSNESPRLPRPVAQHLEIYPEAFATARGLEHIDANGRQVVLVALRRLNEHHPWLPQAADEVNATAVAVAPQPTVVSTVVEVIDAQTSQEQPTVEKGEDGPFDGAPPSQSTQGQNSDADNGGAEGAEEGSLKQDNGTEQPTDDQQGGDEGSAEDDTDAPTGAPEEDAAAAKAAKRAARKAAKKAAEGTA